MKIYSSSPESIASRGGQTHVAKKNLKWWKLKRCMTLDTVIRTEEIKKTTKHTIRNKDAVRLI